MSHLTADWEGLPLLLSTGEAAQLLRVHVNTVKALCRSNKLPAKKVGREWRIQRLDLVDFAEGSTRRPNQLRTATRLAILREIDLAILAARSTREIAAAAVERLREYVGCSRAAVLLFHLEVGEVELLAVASNGPTALPAHARVPLAWFSIADAFWSGQPVLVADVELERPDEPATATLLAEGVRTVLGVPLVVDGKVIGGIDLGDASNRFGDAEIETATQVATSLAIAIQNARLLDEAQASRERSRTLSRRLVEVQEEERRRLSRELHDESAQLMTALQLMLTRLKRDRDCPEAFQPKIDEVRQVANSVVESLRRFAMDLRPPTLDQYGLVPALEGYLAGFQAQTGVRVDLQADEQTVGRLPEHVETALYRLIQESLSNVARHAEASSVSISLRKQRGEIALALRDDGKGFDLDAAMRRGRLGLVGMRERAEMVGGRLRIESTQRGEGVAGGTTILATLPIEELGPTMQAPGVQAAKGPTPTPQPSDPGTSVTLSALAELARAKALTDVLNDLHGALNRVDDPPAILKTALERVMQVMGCTLATVLHRTDGGWEIAQVAGPQEQFVGGRYTDQQVPFVTEAAQTRQVVAVDDAYNDPRYDSKITQELNTRAGVFVPLLTGAEVVDVVTFVEHGTSRHFTPAEVEFAERLQLSLSLALENATLRQAEKQQEQELSRRLEELQTLLELLPAGVGIAYDPECKNIRVNPALAQQVGTPRDANASLSADEAEKQARYRVFRDGRELQPHELPMQVAAATGVAVRGAAVDILREDGEALTLLADAVPLYTQTGQVRGAVSTFVDITERRRAEERAQRQRVILHGVNRILEAALTSETEEELGAVVLTVAKEATASWLGFVGEINAEGRLDDIAMGDLGWAASQISAAAGATGTRHRSVPGGFTIHGIYGRVITGGKGFFTNEPAEHPDRVGTPDGHPPLRAFLGVPLKRGAETTGMIGLGNRDGGYRDEDLEVAEALAPVVVAALDHTRARREIQRLNLDLARRAEELQAILDAIPDGLIVYDADGRITRMNDLAVEMLGYGQDTWKLSVKSRVGKTVVAYNADGSQTDRDAYVALRALRGEVVRNEDLYIHLPARPEKDFWGAFSAAPIWGADGRQAGAVVTMADTTKLHDLNQQLLDALTSVEEREAALSLANEQLQAQAEELQAQAEELRTAAARLEEHVRARTASLEETSERLAEANASLKITLQALRESEDRFRIALKNSHVLVFQQDRDLRYIWMYNPHPHWSPEQALGRTDYDELPYEDADRLAKVKRLAMQTGTGQRAEVLTTVEGQPFYYDLAVEPLRDLEGKIIGITGAAVDITQLKRAQAGLVAQMERLREQSLLLDLTHDAIFVRDMDGTIRFWNRGAMEMYGYTAAEAEGNKSHGLLRTEFPLPLKEIVAELEARGRWEGELKHWTREGRPISVSSRWALFRDRDGKGGSILEINNDITAYKAAEARREEALRELQAHREQLQALSRRLVDLQERERRYVADQLYNEAGQVLAALKMHLARNANGGAADGHVAETQQMLDRVMQDLHHLATHLRPATLDRLGLISALRQYAEEWGREQALDVQFVAGDVERVRLSDAVETAVYRVVQEALMNIAQHAGATSVTVSVETRGDQLVVVVADNGAGFDPRTALISGATGLLGMRERAESVGGRLVVLSTLGGGTSVTMEAPIDRGTSQ